MPSIVQPKVCLKCHGTRQYFYDDKHIKTCDGCCTHSDGWWKLEHHYADNNGKYACRTGCGALRDELSEEEKLIEFTREALTQTFGRQPTEKEVLRTHIGLKRMAGTMYEYLEREDGNDGLK